MDALRDVAYVNAVLLAGAYVVAGATKMRRQRSWVALLELAVAAALIGAPRFGALAALLITASFVAASSSWSFGQRPSPTGSVVVTRTWLLLAAAAVAFAASRPVVPGVLSVVVVAAVWLMGAVVIAMVRIGAEPTVLLAAVAPERSSARHHRSA